MVSNENWLNRILEGLRQRRPSHSGKIERLLPLEDPSFKDQANGFFTKWFKREGAWPIERALDAYTALLDEMDVLQATYARTERYPNASFAQVDASFYQDSRRMRLHLEALALAQFLWIDQWERFVFFTKWMESIHPILHLEVGPGHGLYLSKAVQSTSGSGTRITALDVSPESLETARAIAGDDVHYITADFLKWDPDEAFDTLVMGEVLEHVEEPLTFLHRARSCLHKDGNLFLSTPIHAPMPDHITAYPDLDSLRTLLNEGGFTINREHICAVDRIPLELAQRYLKPIMYSAILIPA